MKITIANAIAALTTIGLTSAAGAVLALGVAPAAQADDGAFIAGVRALGFPRSDNYLIDTAHAICMRFAVGNSRDQADQSIVRQFGVTPEAAHQFVGLATANYCPGSG